MQNIIYLDQNHWITMARARVAREKVQSVAELKAADALWEAATQRRIRLPLSSAHLVETVHGGDRERRHNLALAMLDAYDGWHMASPLSVRRCELVAALGGGRALQADDVFTRAPGAPFYTYDLLGDDPSATPPPLWAAVWRDLLLKETLPEEDFAATDTVIATWAAAHDQLREYLRANPAQRDMRLVAAAVLLRDLRMELSEACVRAGISTSSFTELVRPETAVDFFAGMPFVGRVLEVTRARLSNPQDTWVNHDLNDLLFLACAAGYADHVVAEKKTGHFLDLARTSVTAAGAAVHLNLRSLAQVPELNL